VENGYPQTGQAIVPGRTSLPQSGHLMSVSIRKPQCGQICALSLTFSLHSGHEISILAPHPTAPGQSAWFAPSRQYLQFMFIITVSWNGVNTPFRLMSNVLQGQPRSVW
jgi:hypothetical protein